MNPRQVKQVNTSTTYFLFGNQKTGVVVTLRAHEFSIEREGRETIPYLNIEIQDIWGHTTEEEGWQEWLWLGACGGKDRLKKILAALISHPPFSGPSYKAALFCLRRLPMGDPSRLVIDHLYEFCHYSCGHMPPSALRALQEHFRSVMQAGREYAPGPDSAPNAKNLEPVSDFSAPSPKNSAKVRSRGCEDPELPYCSCPACATEAALPRQEGNLSGN